MKEDELRTRLEKSKNQLKFWDTVSSQKLEEISTTTLSKNEKIIISSGFVLIGFWAVGLSMLLVGII